jgi:hypothetical protein
VYDGSKQQAQHLELRELLAECILAKEHIHGLDHVCSMGAVVIGVPGVRLLHSLQVKRAPSFLHITYSTIHIAPASVMKKRLDQACDQYCDRGSLSSNP